MKFYEKLRTVLDTLFSFVIRFGALILVDLFSHAIIQSNLVNYELIAILCWIGVFFILMASYSVLDVRCSYLSKSIDEDEIVNLDESYYDQFKKPKFSYNAQERKEEDQEQINKSRDGSMKK